MDKAAIESAIKRAKACGPSSARDAVLSNLNAMIATPPLKTYKRAADIETDLRDLESRSA
jgi:hypothetical protein